MHVHISIIFFLITIRQWTIYLSVFLKVPNAIVQLAGALVRVACLDRKIVKKVKTLLDLLSTVRSKPWKYISVNPISNKLQFKVLQFYMFLKKASNGNHQFRWKTSIFTVWSLSTCFIIIIISILTAAIVCSFKF